MTHDNTQLPCNDKLALPATFIGADALSAPNQKMSSTHHVVFYLLRILFGIFRA